MLRDDIHLRLEVFVIGAKVFGGKRLVGKAHVHYGRGMPFSSGKIDESPFGEQIDFAAVFHLKLVHHRTNFALAAGHFFERWNVDLHVEVARVANNRSTFHLFKMLGADHTLVSRHGDVNVAFLHRFSHRHHSETVHRGFDALHRIDFRDDDVGTEALRSEEHTSELQSRLHLVCRLLLEKKKNSCYTYSYNP